MAICICEVELYMGFFSVSNIFPLYYHCNWIHIFMHNIPILIHKKSFSIPLCFFANKVHYLQREIPFSCPVLFSHTQTHRSKMTGRVSDESLKIETCTYITLLSIFLLILLALNRCIIPLVSRPLFSHDCSPQRIPHAPHEHCTKQVLKRRKRVVNAQQQRREFEVDKEDDDAEINDGMWGLDVVESLQKEHGWGNKARLRRTEITKSNHENNINTLLMYNYVWRDSPMVWLCYTRKQSSFKQSLLVHHIKRRVEHKVSGQDLHKSLHYLYENLYVTVTNGFGA